MSVEKNKAIVRRHYEELWQKGDLDVADEIYASDAVGHFSTGPDLVNYPADERELVRADKVAFPDAIVTIEDQIAEGDKVLTRWRFRATNTGTFYGNPPTGRVVEVTGTHLHRIVDDKIVEIWAQPDALSFMTQLGLLPSPAEVG